MFFECRISDVCLNKMGQNDGKVLRFLVCVHCCRTTDFGYLRHRKVKVLRRLLNVFSSENNANLTRHFSFVYGMFPKIYYGNQPSIRLLLKEIGTRTYCAGLRRRLPPNLKSSCNSAHFESKFIHIHEDLGTAK